VPGCVTGYLYVGGQRVLCRWAAGSIRVVSGLYQGYVEGIRVGSLQKGGYWL